MKKPTLLIVDDEYRIGQLISKLIHYEELGIELLGVYDSSEQAYGAILLNHPDIVISDIKMPVMDGLELVKKVIENDLHPHFVFISGFREFEYAHTALKYGVEDYLLKPVKESELNAVLQRVGQAHLQKIQHAQETKRLQEEAHRGHIMAGADAVSVLEQAGQPVSWQSFNETYHTDVRPGKLLAFEIKLDYQQLDQMDDIQDRLVVNNVIAMTESRLRPKVQEQLYAVDKKTGVLCVLNYPASSSAEVRRELHTVFVDVKQYLCAFPEYQVTMALGDEAELDGAAATLETVRHRLRQRVLLGVDRLIAGTDCRKDCGQAAELDAACRSQVHNVVEALSVQAVSESVDAQLQRVKKIPDCDPVIYSLLAERFLECFFTSLPPESPLQKEQAKLQKRLEQCWSVPMLFEVLKQAMEEILEELRLGQQQKTLRPVREAEDYIAQHYAEKVTLEEIAELLHMNPSYFSTLFKKETGKNFQNYLQDYRIERAKKLLRTTNETMMSIAEQVGYTDTRYFSQCFVKVVGIKPSLYRKMYS